MTLPLLQLVEEEEVNMMKVCQSSTKVYWTYLFLATAQQVTLSLTPSLNKGRFHLRFSGIRPLRGYPPPLNGKSVGEKEGFFP